MQVKSKAPVKFITIRATAFEASPGDGGSAVIEKGYFFINV